MTKYRITILVESDENPSALLDAFHHAVDQGYINAELRLDHEAEEAGEAVCVEEV
jgi:hypothetical protein